MKTLLVENNGSEKHIYDSVLLDPTKMKMLSSPLALKIAHMLGEEELCAIDIARKLKIHEQNVYYHLHNLEKAGIVKISRSEMRYGMTAKIYMPVASVVAAKLYENGHVVDDFKSMYDPTFAAFMKPFIISGKLNAKIVVGDPYSHGKYDEGAKEGAYIFNFAMMLGRLLGNPRRNMFELDTDFIEDEINDNLILFGNPKTNSVIDRLNEFMPVKYSASKDSIGSKTNGKEYSDPRIGYIIRMPNPFNKKKEILSICGIRSRGFHAAILAFTTQFEKTIEKLESNNGIAIVRGKDSDSDRIIDNIIFLE